MGDVCIHPYSTITIAIDCWVVWPVGSIVYCSTFLSVLKSISFNWCSGFITNLWEMLLLADFLDLKNKYNWLIPSSKEQGGAVEACWAHNPEVNGSAVNLSRAFCDPGPRSNQMMSAARHLALINTIKEIGANYKMVSTIKK